ncbi:Uncharacterized protein dnm_009580 [Desulfonema magnum]|uniref:Uncharacterized protein n=1 Tax=Desulfonema magnum TaxID=45655 RepID=A0A975BGU3_9BACT|nr:Uncharacterized protein dnm_009580 [Desulfonema magnum]
MNRDEKVYKFSPSILPPLAKKAFINRNLSISENFCKFP